MNYEEWMPHHYLLQIRKNICNECGNTEIASELWLVEQHTNRKDITRRKQAFTIDARLARGRSERTVNVTTCSNCFEEFEPIYVCRDEDLELIRPGDPSKRLIKTLEDII